MARKLVGQIESSGEDQFNDDRRTHRNELHWTDRDQSPYIINADLSYDNERSGTSVTLAYNYAAERLALIVNNGWDIYEQPAPSLDLVISQRLGQGFKVKFTARNLLNPKIQRTYGVSGPSDDEFVYSSFTRGVTLGLSFSYEY